MPFDPFDYLRDELEEAVSDEAMHQWALKTLSQAALTARASWAQAHVSDEEIVRRLGVLGQALNLCGFTTEEILGMAKIVAQEVEGERER